MACRHERGHATPHAPSHQAAAQHTSRRVGRLWYRSLGFGPPRARQDYPRACAPQEPISPNSRAVTTRPARCYDHRLKRRHPRLNRGQTQPCHPRYLSENRPLTKQPPADPRRDQIRAEQPEKPRDPRAARPEVQPKPPAPCMPHACPCERLAQSEVAQSLAEAKTSGLSDPVSLSPRSWCCKPIRRSEGADATPLCRSLSVEPPHRPAPACRNDARIRSAREMGRTAGKGTQHG